MNREVIVRLGFALSVASLLVLSGGALGAPKEVPASAGLKGEGAVTAMSPSSARDLRLPISEAERAEAAQGARAFATGGRGLLGPVLMRDNLEAYAPGSMGGTGIAAPPSFLDPPDFPWGLNNLRGQGNQNFVSLVDLSGSPLGGSNGVVNASQVLRLRTGTAQPSGGFFIAANLRWDPVLIAGADQAAVGSAEHYLSTIEELYTFETANLLTGFITARLIWGGPCDPDIHGDCGDPINPVINSPPNFYFLGVDPDSFTTGMFMPSAYCIDAQGDPIPGCVPPSGLAVGDAAPIPTQNWVRLAWSFAPDGTMTALLDLQDGTGAVPIAQSVIITSPSLNRVGWWSGFGVQDATLHVDNIEASGYVFDTPVGPELGCPLLDSLEWLNPGPLLGQSADWFASLSGGVSVVEDGAQGQVLQQTNAGFGFYTESARRTLPDANAFPGNPWSLCIDAETVGSGTVRAFSVEGASGLAARVFIGRQDDPFDSTVYVQINESYDPNDNLPPVIGVDIESTGYVWAPGEYRTLCMTVDSDADLVVTVNGATIYTGQAFRTSVNSFAFESDNSASGAGDVLRIDNVFFNCEDAPKVTLPPFTLPYCDDFEWAVEGLPIDDNFGASQRYGANDFVTVESIDLAPVGVSQVVAMPNVFQDTEQPPVPDFSLGAPFIFSQLFVSVPNVTVDITTGWRVSMDLAMNDFTTSRGFSPAQFADVGPAFELVGYLWYHAPNDRFYLFSSGDGASAGDAPTVIDTGFTRTALGIDADEIFSVQAEYIPVTGKIRWSINGTVIGTTNPILGTDGMGAPRLHQNIDAIFVWGGDDDTAPSTPPLSTLYLDNLCVTQTQRCFSDVNGDGVTNFADLNIVLSDFGGSGDGIPGDVNLDGVVNFFDLNAVLSQFGDECD
jgi:hypothetical protein